MYIYVMYIYIYTYIPYIHHIHFYILKFKCLCLNILGDCFRVSLECFFYVGYLPYFHLWLPF